MTKRLINLTLLWGVLFISCKSNQQDNLKTIAPTHSVTLGGFMTCDTNNYIFIRSSLKNNSEDTLQCVSMNCSWDDAYKFDTDELEIVKNICFLNGPMLIKIAPHNSYNNYLKLTTSKKEDEWRHIVFKLGYNFVLRDSSIGIFSQVEQISDMKNVIWSDTVRISDFWNQKK